MSEIFSSKETQGLKCKIQHTDPISLTRGLGHRCCSGWGLAAPEAGKLDIASPERLLLLSYAVFG